MRKKLKIAEELIAKCVQLINNKSYSNAQILFSAAVLQRDFNFFRHTYALQSEEIYYPVKTNSQIDVLKLLKEWGSGFEISSPKELRILMDMAVLPDRILHSHPVKQQADIVEAYNFGLRKYTLDSTDELQKLEKAAPDAQAFVRLQVNNSGAGWELEGKFGVAVDKAPALIAQIAKSSLQFAGLSLHVGWNNATPVSWKKTLAKIYNLVQNLEKQGLKTPVVNLGGGFPAHLVDRHEMLQHIHHNINPFLEKMRNSGLKIIAEPGSFLMANAAVLLMRVYAIQKRSGNAWVFVDTGAMQGFYWILSGLQYAVVSLQQLTVNVSDMSRFTVTGSSMDSHDVFCDNCLLPASLKAGDFLLVVPAGAYIYSAKEYNGIPYPEQIVF